MRTLMQLPRLSAFVAAAALSLTACGGDSPTNPTPTYNDISGSYSGALAGVSQGWVMTGTFTVSLTQSSGSLSGTYSLAGNVSSGLLVIPVQSTGTLSGTIAAGNNPSVNLTLKYPPCAAYSANFSGAYDTANRRLTMTGPVDLLDDTCGVALHYNGTFILNR